MHVAAQLRAGYFECREHGETVPPQAILGDWHPLDRFGIVVDEALGALGASLLMQLAITQFYECKPERKRLAPCYPEIYVFHFGGPHGDFSHFDVWPPRKEVSVPSREPLALLEAINAHGISVLALPEGAAGDTHLLEAGPSSWAEQGSAVDRPRASFTYSPAGRVNEPEFEIRSTSTRTRENISGTLDLKAAVQAVRDRVETSGTVTEGVMGDVDDLRWGVIVEQRFGEVSDAAFERAAATSLSSPDAEPGALLQSYARLTAAEALERITSLGGHRDADGTPPSQGLTSDEVLQR